MAIRYVEASLFDAPRHSVLVHACNARGSWSGGIALAFKSRYPDAYTTYRDHCLARTAATLVGTTQLIRTHDQKWIACLFTSDRGGGSCDSSDRILRATRSALKDLVRQVRDLNHDVPVVAACKFNSGIFAVPWEKTAAVIAEVGIDMDVYVPQPQ